MWTFAKFVACLPELIQIFKTLQKLIMQAEANRKVKDDLQAINDAFASGDKSKLDHIFSVQSPPAEG